MFANSKITAYNWIVVGLMAVTFIVLLKIVTAKVPVPGLSEIAAMA